MPRDPADHERTEDDGDRAQRFAGPVIVTRQQLQSLPLRISRDIHTYTSFVSLGNKCSVYKPLLARDANAKHAIIIAQRLSVHPSVLLCVRDSFCSVANMVFAYSVYFSLITFYGRHSATINLDHLDSSSILPLSQ